MKTIKQLTILFLFAFVSQTAFAQETIKTHSFKKGEVLDILLVERKPNIEKEYKRYRETAFTVAIKESFKLLQASGTSNLQGNIEPNVFIIGKWDNLEKRENFLTDIYNQVPDFDEQRRTIFSIFNLTYYEMPKDVTFSINNEKYNVATAYWKKDDKNFDAFLKKYKKESNSSGGKTVVELTNGKSPYKYYYNPDYFVITEWDSKEEFDEFHKKNNKMNTEGLLNVNQFLIK
ncbi:hypothetical protein UMM65_17230 [Aureibaculum sp. 2210JD6-5]|uniref:hypothetical protein n=1 Tax=Aureibaculum sp. 2210JD6-5 TaxID=3103957 RepID=UPI002AAD7BDB|nr:hypothetical protein [Aureibaculum sp. 2210JD6-5]MDY7396991.1 hypothetical protein [Aureibaculum sp. 2210JD6-5]